MTVKNLILGMIALFGVSFFAAYGVYLYKVATYPTDKIMDDWIAQNVSSWDTEESE